MRRILVIGGYGTIGKKVCERFEKKHEVIIDGRKAGDREVNITDGKSIEAIFDSLGKVDAIVCIAGEDKWAAFASMAEEDFYIGLQGKLMEQFKLVRISRNYLYPGGSFALKTGMLADHPVVLTTSAAMVNGGLHSLVKAVAPELKDGIRRKVVNIKSPGKTPRLDPAKTTCFVVALSRGMRLSDSAFYRDQ